ncbi:hypothetical protein K7432_010273 [Basidiobolus ranarum]|uniref:Serine/threonine-protein phosphatase 4 regulatory subunit 2 n=1 Tax=Basidiobolus ranarum TaxID=34480 RepID=A0ABR2WNY6_9FUNG
MTEPILQNNETPSKEGQNTTIPKDNIEEIIEYVAQSNIFNGSWEEVRLRLVAKIDHNIEFLATEFNTEITEEIREYQTRIVKALEVFKKDPPFTVQRLCELIVYPKEHHKTLPKYMRALEKVVTVTSTYVDFPSNVNGDIDDSKINSKETDLIDIPEEPVSMESEATTTNDEEPESAASNKGVEGSKSKSPEPSLESLHDTIKSTELMEAAVPSNTQTTDSLMENESTTVPADDIELMKRGDVDAATAGPVESNPLNNGEPTNDQNLPELMESEANTPGKETENMDTDDESNSIENQDTNPSKENTSQEMDTTS